MPGTSPRSPGFDSLQFSPAGIERQGVHREALERLLSTKAPGDCHFPPCRERCFSLGVLNHRNKEVMERLSEEVVKRSVFFQARTVHSLFRIRSTAVQTTALAGQSVE